MSVIGGNLGYRLLKAMANPGRVEARGHETYKGRSKVESLLGNDVWREIAGKTVIDFGCGSGEQSVEMALHGASYVVGIDIQERLLERGRRLAAHKGVGKHCSFSRTAPLKADVIVTIDAFEHFADPAKVLGDMRALLKPGGYILASFGPTWLHPYGGHLFSVFPWAHLLFGEDALLRWRNDFKRDGATRFSDVAGGLNRLTIARFEQIVAQSPFRLAQFEAVPIGRLKRFYNNMTREFLASVIRCRLVPREAQSLPLAATA